MWLWMLLFPAVIFGLTALIPLNLEIYYRQRGREGYLRLSADAWFGIKYTRTVPAPPPVHRPPIRPLLKRRSVVQTGTTKEPVKRENRPDLSRYLSVYHLLKRHLPLGKRLWPALRYFLHRLELRHFQWRTLVGLPDAAQTGLAVGGLWSLKGLVLTGLYRMFKGKSAPPDVAVVPCFTGPAFGLLFHCIFTIRIGHIMVTVIKLAYMMFVYFLNTTLRSWTSKLFRG
ncbi:MAG TPA: DUF2953 domain-containing protein [Desulfotomaculum sp.]|nr:DUF2953 domain-containing protein [Desulfotomaculum sp.]